MSPAGKSQCFAVRRGELTERLDPHYYLPEFAELVAQIQRAPHKPLGELVSQSDETWDGNTKGCGCVFPYIEISAVGLGTNEYTVAQIETEFAPSRARMIVKAGDLLISTTRPDRGAVALVRKEDEDSIASTGFAVLRDIKQDGVTKEFLLNAISSTLVLRQLLQRSSGGSYPAITASEIDKVLIPLPPLSRQRDLVAAIEAARAAQRAKLAEAEVLLADVDDYMLQSLELRMPEPDAIRIYAIRHGDCRIEGRVDAGFHQPYYRRVEKALSDCSMPKISLGEISPEIVGGATPKSRDREFYADSGVKFLRIMNVKANQFDLCDLNYIKPEVHEGELKRSQLEGNDVLMTITGRVGNAAVVSRDLLPANINQHIVRLRIVRGDILPEYIAAFLNTKVGLALSNRGVTGGTRMALDYSAIRKLSIPMPAIGVQERIVKELNARRREAFKLRQQAETDWQQAKADFETALLGRE